MVGPYTAKRGDMYTVPKQALYRKPDGHRKRGRPKNSWRRNPTMKYRTTGWTGDRWKLLRKTDEDGDIWSVWPMLHWEQRGSSKQVSSTSLLPCTAVNTSVLSMMYCRWRGSCSSRCCLSWFTGLRQVTCTVIQSLPCCLTPSWCVLSSASDLILRNLCVFFNNTVLFVQYFDAVSWWQEVNSACKKSFNSNLKGSLRNVWGT